LAAVDDRRRTRPHDTVDPARLPHDCARLVRLLEERLIESCPVDLKSAPSAAAIGSKPLKLPRALLFDPDAVVSNERRLQRGGGGAQVTEKHLDAWMQRFADVEPREFRAVENGHAQPGPAAANRRGRSRWSGARHDDIEVTNGFHTASDISWNTNEARGLPRFQQTPCRPIWQVNRSLTSRLARPVSDGS
jgi:hypothetical protein